MRIDLPTGALDDGQTPGLPSGSSDEGSTGGGEDVTILVVGRLCLRPLGEGADGVIDRYVDNVFPVECFLESEDGSAAPSDGTLTATISRNGTVIVSDIEVTVRWSNIISFVVPAEATDTRGTLRLTVTRNASETDIQTFGPLLVRLSNP